MAGRTITALYATSDGKIYDAPGIVALGRSANMEGFTPEDLIPLPEGADLMFLSSVGLLAGNARGLMSLPGQAVSAILPADIPYLPRFSARKKSGGAALYGYTSVALYRISFMRRRHVRQ